MKRILIIEDEPSFRETVVQSLKVNSFETLEAENGKAGVRLAQEHQPDLILSDIRMESFDGFATLAALRYQPITATIPVILMTGEPDESGRRMAMEFGADDYLAKPFTIGSLLASVNIQLKKREAIRQQVLNLRPSEADRDEVNAVSETGAPQESRQAMGEADRTCRTSQMAPGIPEDVEPGSVLGCAAAAIDENSRLAIEVFVRMLNTYHPNLGSSARRAVVLCQALGQVLNLPSHELSHLIQAAALCDVSLVGINHLIVRRWLRHPHNLSKDEWSLIRKHPEESQHLLDAWPAFRGAGEIIHSHHEHWDGSGFPEGLRGERIPWLARLLAVANYYCSRYDPRDMVLGELELHAESFFDPRAIAAVARAAQRANLPGGQREILLTELHGGLVLARDLRNTNGVVLLPKGRKISDAIIARLMAINRARPIDQSVFVYS